MKAQQADNAQTRQLQQQLLTQARGDIGRLYPQAQETRRAGYADALALFGETIPQQFDLLQRGRANVEDTYMQGQSQVQRALLGLPTDMSGLRKEPLQVDTSFSNRYLPEVQSTQAQPFNFSQYLQGFGYYPGVRSL